MADALTIDLNDLTLGELEDIEDAVGATFTSLVANKESIPTKALSALVWVVRRRTEPDFTLDDARALKLTDVDLTTEEPDPTNAAA